MKDSIAIIDLGSNSIRMNIYVVNSQGGFGLYEQASEMVRLSEGMGEDVTLKEIPIQRTLKALEYFKKLIDVNRVKRVYPLATAAVRLAKNKDAFLERVHNETGFEFQVLSGNDEAYYDYLGVVNSMEMQNALIVDIGGGSTELIWMENRTFKEAVSLPIGSVTLSEKFKNIGPQKNRLKKAEAYIKSQYHDIPWIGKLKGYPIIGLGGVIRTLGKVDRSKNGYPIENLHNYRLHISEVERLCDEIFSKSPKKLEKISGISKRRSDIIAVGLMPFKCLIDLIKAPEIRISGNGLRDGYFYERHFQEVMQSPVVPDVLKHSVENMMRRYKVNASHAAHVKHLCEQLFVGLNPFVEFDKGDKRLLEIAAMLHDIGMHIDYYDHQIHGYYLIMNGRFEGLTNAERLKVAFLVGNHRVSGIKNPLKEYHGIVSQKELDRLWRLAIILMICEQLDRAENGAVESLQVNQSSEGITVLLNSSQELDLEIASADQLSDRFEKTYKWSIKFARLGTEAKRTPSLSLNAKN